MGGMNGGLSSCDKCVSFLTASRRGEGGHTHRLFSHNCDCWRSMVNGQSVLRNTVNKVNGRSQCKMDGHVCKNNSL